MKTAICALLLFSWTAPAAIIPPKLKDQYTIQSLGKNAIIWDYRDSYFRTVSNEHYGIVLRWVYINDRNGGDVLLVQTSKDGKKWQTLGKPMRPSVSGITVRLARGRYQFRIVAKGRDGEEAPSNVIMPPLSHKLFAHFGASAP